MDLGLTGRSALLFAVDSALATSCSEVLAAEGVRTVHDLSDTDGIDIVIASDGGRSHPALLEVDSADDLHDAWTAVVDAVDVYRRALPRMAERGWGRFVWIGSAAAKSLDTDDDDMGAIVSLAMMAAHKVVAAENGPANVTANTVLCGGVATDEDVASTVAFLCSEGAGYLTGVTIMVDGGVGSAVF